jgi:CRISPR-associated protein Cas4
LTQKSNEFDQLIKFIDDNKKDTNDLLNDINQLEEYSTKYKELNTTNGFDVKQFKSRLKQELINEHIRKQNYDRPNISITELLECPRRIYYERKKYDIDLRNSFNFVYLGLAAEIGNTNHKFIQDNYDFTEIEKTIISENYKTKGRVDAIKNNFLYEIKPVDQKNIKNAFNIKHLQQCSIGAYILNNEYNYRIDTITIIYYIRDNFRKDPISFDYKYDEKIGISFLEKALDLHKCLENNKLPEKSNNKNDCEYCLYKNYCLSDEKKSINKLENKEEVIFLL